MSPTSTGDAGAVAARREPGPLRLLLRAPLAVWALVVLNGLLITCWSVLTPTYHSPDEPTHADAVMRLVEGYGWGYTERTHFSLHGYASVAVSPYGLPSKPHSLNHRPVPQSTAVARESRPDWADLDPRLAKRPLQVQQMTQHPPGYYYVEAAVVKIFGGAHQRWDRAVGLMRLVSMLLIAPLPLLAWATAFRLTDDRRAGIAAAVFPLAVPELTQIGGSVNNDNALTLAAGLVVLGVVCVLRGQRDLRTAVYVGITLGLALFTKGLALVLPPLVLAAYVTSWAYDRRRAVAGLRPAFLRSVGRPVALVALLTFAFGGWWWFTNLLRYGKVQPAVPNFAPGGYLGDDLGRMIDYGTRGMLQRWWGAMGWFEVQMPFRWVYTAGAVALLCIVLALTRRRPERTRTGVLLVLWPTLASYGMVAGASFSYYLHTHYYRGLSGRYLFVGMVGVAAAVGIGAVRFGPLRRWAPLLLLAGAALIQYKAIKLALLVWWRPRGGEFGQAWDAMLAWSPWGPHTVKALVLLAVVAALAVLAELVRSALRRDPDDLPPPPPPGEHQRVSPVRGPIEPEPVSPAV